MTGSGWEAGSGRGTVRRSMYGGADCPAERRWGRHDGDPAADRQRQADDLALAGALHGRGRRRVAARGHPPGRQAAVEMTLAEPPGERTHWTDRAMAKASGISHRSVQR